VALAPDATVGEALQAIGQAGLAQLCAALEALRERPAPEGVHRARVASRRLRAMLKIFKPLARDDAARALDAELAWLAGELDAARDLDVFIGEVWEGSAQGAAFEGRDVFERGLNAARASAYLRMEAALESPRARDVLLEAAAWLEAGAWTTDSRLADRCGESARAFAAEALAHRQRRIGKAARRFDELDAHGRHKLRLKGKTLRYALEDLASLFPEHPRRVEHLLDAARAVQDTLGALNDRVVRQALVDRVAEGDSALALSAARVALRDDNAELRQAARTALDRLVAARPLL
jgi:inorganic triphosphatase YgiF